MKTHKPIQQRKQHSLYKPKPRVISLKSAAWRKLRAQVLAEQPLCEFCYDDHGLVVRATVVDHIDNNGDNNHRANLRSLCKSCHDKKTRDDMLGRQRRVVGCDQNGMPLDPDHPWNNH